MISSVFPDDRGGARAERPARAGSLAVESGRRAVKDVVEVPTRVGQPNPKLYGIHETEKLTAFQFFCSFFLLSSPFWALPSHYDQLC